MPQTSPKPSILLIDDNQDVLDGLTSQLAKLLHEDHVDIRCWQPTRNDDDPKSVFDNMIDDSTVLVATDYDLTSQGLKGLFGLTIVGWCQKQAIPVGDFSRGNTNELPTEPNLFELRVPTDDIEGARFIANTFKGFQAIRTGIKAMPDLSSSNFSPAGVLAKLLGKPNLENQFALYMSRLGSANSALFQRLSERTNATSDNGNVQQVLTYVLGHLLLNAILKFPGPILSDRALCAYCGTTIKEKEVLHKLFDTTKYDGPFGDNARYYWRESVDETIDMFGENIPDQQFDDFGDFNRAVCEAKLGCQLDTHECPHENCGGKKGGFLCPFTNRTVCQRADCSVAASSWIPQGAGFSRVEREFYDEWAPLLGL